MSFLPEGYQVPEPEHSNYLELVQGENRIRILSDAFIVWQYWIDAEGKVSSSPVKGVKPVYVREEQDIPEAVAKDANLKKKQVWFFTCFDYADEQIKICKLTQVSLMRAIESYDRHPDWLHPKDYDLIINRSGEGLNTSYQVLVGPKKPLNPGIVAMAEAMDIDLTAILRGEDPFGSADEEQKQEKPQPQATASQVVQSGNGAYQAVSR